MINHQHRCIFVHIPKTGGNSINRVFGTSWEDHQDLASYAETVTPSQFASYHKFAIVRNPWDRMFSDYNYQKKKSRGRDAKLFLFTEAGNKRRFRQWVSASLADPHRYEPARWGATVSAGIHRWSPQVDWISLNGKIAVDQIFRLEQLGADFPKLCERVGLPATNLPRRNRRLHWHYSWYYDQETRDLVADYYAKDIESFGYQFESRPEQVRRLARACIDSIRNVMTLTDSRVLPRSASTRAQ